MNWSPLKMHARIISKADIKRLFQQKVKLIISYHPNAG